MCKCTQGKFNKDKGRHGRKQDDEGQQPTRYLWNERKWDRSRVALGQLPLKERLQRVR